VDEPMTRPQRRKKNAAQQHRNAPDMPPPSYDTTTQPSGRKDKKSKKPVTGLAQDDEKHNVIQCKLLPACMRCQLLLAMADCYSAKLNVKF